MGGRNIFSPTLPLFHRWMYLSALGESETPPGARVEEGSAEGKYQNKKENITPENWI